MRARAASSHFETDRIELLAIRAVGLVGLLPEERQRPQPVEVDLVIELDTRTAGATDDLAHSVDYGVAVSLVVSVITEGQHLLLETVAARIAEGVLALARVEGVEVAVRKLRPPVPHDVASSGVRVHRRRHDLVVLDRPPTTAYVALGSNLGDRREHLRLAVRSLPDVRAVSGVYETDPVGGPDDQGPYLNMVVELETRLDPFRLLETCRRIEAVARRERIVRWGPRTLDLDVLLYGDVRIESEELTVPHPRMWQRRFVLAPLAEIAPEAVPPDWDTRLADGGVRRVGDLDV